MLCSPAFTFPSVYPLGFGFLAGLRLFALRQFSAFLSALRRLGYAVLFRGSRPSPAWGFPVLAFGSNRSVKPTRLRRAAYFRSLGL
ncbi:DUF1010 domain-containing protein [Simplicispira psychrophila]|uniref:DUF1010 domain-containing protein n=1 Tax=Simplicispira psychrophila TaxID=80882 RepID=UPI00316ADBF3